MCRLANSKVCTGCMACMNACAKSAISFVQDKEGFLQPSVDENKCIDCHLCEKSCPEIQKTYHQNSGEPDVYAGWHTKDRCVSSSGGAFSSVARYVMERGGAVCGAVLNENLECKHEVGEDLKDIERMRGSKYIQSAVGLSYSAVKKLLLADRYVLFTGTPCQVSGLLSFLGKDYPKLVTMDLICHGVPSNALFLTYIEKLNNRLGFAENNIITNYEFRRRDGWGFSPSISTSGNSCKIKIKGINGLYMSAFDKAAIFRESCYQCHYATTSRVGDFSVGDFWGLGHQGIPFKYDMTKGVSLMIVNTEKGSRIMETLDGSNFYIKRSLKEACARNHNLTKVSNRPLNREKVIRMFMNKGVNLDTIESECHLIDRSLKAKLTALSETIGIYDILKKIHNLIG